MGENLDVEGADQAGQSGHIGAGSGDAGVRAVPVGHGSGGPGEQEPCCPAGKQVRAVPFRAALVQVADEHRAAPNTVTSVARPPSHSQVPNCPPGNLGLDRNIGITYGSYIRLLVRNYEPTRSPLPGRTSQQPPCSSYLETKTVVLNDTPTSYWQ
jgi:hypothetical protein